MTTPRPSAASRAAAAAAREGANVRERVREATVDVIRRRKLGLDDMAGVVNEVMTGAVAGLDNAMPASRESVLRQVVDGLSDAWAAAASATGDAVAEARRRGRRFAKNDLAETAHDLRQLEGRFTDTLSTFADRLGGQVRTELRSVVERMRSAGTEIRPAAQSAARAVDGHVLELGREVVETAPRVVREAATRLMFSASGLLQGIAESIQARPKAARTAKKSGAKKKAGAAKRSATPKAVSRKTTKKPARRPAAKKAKKKVRR